VIIVFCCQGCTVSSLRKESINLSAQSFANIPDGQMFSREIELKIKVHVVSDRGQFSYGPYRSAAMGVAGYANTNNEIWLIGKMVGGRIIVNQTVLGHELNHLLNWQRPEITNPDQLDKIGY
jgi:hypothetical protein